jgi:hypothetical protein
MSRTRITTAPRMRAELRALVSGSYTPRLAELTTSRGTFVVSVRFVERLRSFSLSESMYEARPARAVSCMTPSRLPRICSSVTPGLRRPTTCSHQLVGWLSLAGPGLSCDSSDNGSVTSGGVALTD